MGNSALGFLIGIGVDSAQAEERLHDFEAACGKTFKGAAGSTEPFDKALLNQHQSVHLLAEEMGIHLPRAVVGAIGEMLPGIGELGGALLGAFAVERVYEWAKSAADVIRETYGEVDQAVKDVGAAAEQVAKQTHDNVLKIYTDFKTTAAAVLPMEDVDAQAEKLKKYVQDFMELEKVGGDLRRLPAEAIREIGEAAKEGITNLDQARTKLNEVGALQYEEHKRLAELTKTEDHARCEAAIKDAKDLLKANDEALDALFRHELGLARMYQYQIHQFVTLQENARAEAGQINTIIPMFRDLNQQVDTYIDRNRELADVTVHLNAVRRIEIGILQGLHDAGEHEAHAMKDQLAGLQSAASGFAGLIAGQREAAAVNAVFDAAKGAEQVAMALDPYDPNHVEHWISAAQFFVSSAEFAKVAGTSSHHRGIDGGGSGGRASGSYGSSRGGYSDRGAGNPPPQTLAAGAQSGQFGTAHVVIYSSDQQLAEFVGGAVNRAVQSGFHVTATSSMRGAPVGH